MQMRVIIIKPILALPMRGVVFLIVSNVTSPAPSTSSTSSRPPSSARHRSSRARWTKKLHQWHWISSAICLIGMILFAVTGITLNHAGQIEAQPQVSTQQAQLPAELLASLTATAETKTPQAGQPAILPEPLVAWLHSQLALQVRNKPAEWSDDGIYLALPRPGGDAWLHIDLLDGAVEYEKTERGWIAWLNDLHKGRHTGLVWSWFIDIFALACLIFSLTGLLLLKLHSANRGMTWPLVAAGLVMPALLIMISLH